MSKPISTKLSTIIMGGAVIAIIGGGVGLIANITTNTQALSNAISANGVQITNLTTGLKDLRDANSKYVTQDTFTEFKRAADADREERHDFQVRMDQQIALLVAEHSRPVKTR